MSHRIQAGLAATAALACVAGAFYWLGGRNAQAPPTLASAAATATAPIETPSVRDAGSASSPASRLPAEVRKVQPAADPGPPLRDGEVLEYSADVSNLSNVANLKLQVAEKRDFLGKSAWHLQAFAHTENPLRIVFALDDQFDSYSDAADMTSLQYEMHLDERGQKVTSIQRMTVTGKELAPANATETRVLPGTRDPLGMMQYLRNVDWTKTVEVRSPVYDGHKLYDVRAKFASRGEAVTVPAGSYKTSKIEIRVFENRAEIRDSYFTLYVADNAARTPVLLEAVLPFATARVELLRAR